MTDWKEDLWNLLNGVGGDEDALQRQLDAPLGTTAAARRSADPTPGQAIGGVLGSAPAQAAFAVMDAPLSAAKFGLGFGIGGINEVLGLLPGQPGYEPGTSAALHAGGPRAAWEEIREDQPKWFQAPTEVLLDPMTWTGIGAAGGAAKGARALRGVAEAAGDTRKAMLLGGAAKGLEIAQAVNDVPGRFILEGGTVGGRQIPGVQAGVRRVGEEINRRAPGALDLSPRARVKQAGDLFHNTLNDRSASGLAMGQRSSVLAPPTGSLPPAYPHHLGLRDEQNALLNQTFSDGTTYGAFADKATTEAARDQGLLQSAGASWKADASLEEKIASVRGLPQAAELETVIRTWDDQGIDLLYAAHPNDAATLLFERSLAKDQGIKPERSVTGALLRAAFGEQALLSGRYHTGNIQGSMMMNAVRGHWQTAGPSQYWAGFKVARGGANAVSREDALASLHVVQGARKWGDEFPPIEVLRGGTQKMISDDTFSTRRYSPSAMGELAGRITKSPRVGRAVGRPFIANNNFALAVDYMGRGTAYDSVYQGLMESGLPAWEREVRRRAGGIPNFEFSARGGASSPPSFAFKPLRTHLESLGLDSGDAQRLARDFNEMKGINKKRAVSQMQEIQFSYARTNMDEWVGKYIPFHYWYSRALRFWGEESLRNPYLILNYMRANDGIEDAQEDPGLSARQKGFLRIMGTPLGFSLLMNPDALFGVVRVLGMDRPEDPMADPNAAWSDAPSGMTPIGGTIDWLKSRGLGLYPWIDGLMNMMGMYGNTFEPDLLGIRHRALVGSAVNMAMSQFGAQPPGSPYANAMGQARWVLSSTASQFLPGWIAQPVAPKAGGSTQQASLETIIENAIIANNPTMTNEQLLEVMSDPDSPEYEAAYQQAAQAGVVQQLLNFVVPAQFAMRHDARDVATAQTSLIREAAEKQGVTPFEFAPTVGDLEFAADYERKTGKPWRPGDFADADFKRDLARAPDEESKRFIFQQNAYHSLGTPAQEKAFDTYTALRYGDDPRTSGLPEATRNEVAQTWLDRSGNSSTVSEIYDLRDAFTARNPQFAAFQDWQDKVRQVGTMYGGLAEYRRQAAQANPNAARYFSERQAYLLRTDPTNLEARLDEDTVSAAAYLAITGNPSLRSVEGAIPGAPTADIALPGMLPAAPPQTPYNPQENWMAQLARHGRSQGVETPRW